METSPITHEALADQNRRLERLVGELLRKNETLRQQLAASQRSPPAPASGANQGLGMASLFSVVAEPTM